MSIVSNLCVDSMNSQPLYFYFEHNFSNLRLLTEYEFYWFSVWYIVFPVHFLYDSSLIRCRCFWRCFTAFWCSFYVNRSPSYSCLSTAPIPVLEASFWSINSLLKSIAFGFVFVLTTYVVLFNVSFLNFFVASPSGKRAEKFLRKARVRFLGANAFSVHRWKVYMVQ